MTRSKTDLFIKYILSNFAVLTLSKSLCFPPARIHNCEVAYRLCSLIVISTLCPFIRSCFSQVKTLELIHSGIYKQQRRIILWNYITSRYNNMVILFEKVKPLRAELTCCDKDRSCWRLQYRISNWTGIYLCRTKHFLKSEFFIFLQ